MAGRDGRWTPHLEDFAAHDRRRVIERLWRRARLCAADHPSVIAIVAHGELAGRAQGPVTRAQLLVVVDERPDRRPDADAYAARFADIDGVETEIEVESRAGFRARLAAGDPALAEVRDRAVVLVGALPLGETRAW